MMSTAAKDSKPARLAHLCWSIRTSIVWSGFQQQDLSSRVLRQSSGEGGSRGTCTDNYVVISNHRNIRRCSSRCMGAHELADSIDRLLTLIKYACERRPYVNHVLADIKRNLYAGAARALGQPGRVVKQRLGGANLDQQRRKSREVGIQWRGERCARISSGQIASRMARQFLLPNEVINGGFGRHRHTCQLEIDPG